MVFTLLLNVPLNSHGDLEINTTCITKQTEWDEITRSMDVWQNLAKGPAVIGHYHYQGSEVVDMIRPQLFSLFQAPR